MAVFAKKIEVVPSAADALRAAVAMLQEKNQALAEALAKVERLRSLDKEIIEAQAAVKELAAAQTEAFHEWATSGGKGNAPTVDEKASRAAAERLEAAQRQQQASQAAMKVCEAEYLDGVEAVKAAEIAVNVAAANVLGPEGLAKYQRYREQLTDLLLLEHELTLIRARLMDLQLPNASAFAAQMGEKFKYDRIPHEETAAVKKRASELEFEHWHALLRGEV